jgi:FkbM family methyltransferase
MSGSIASRGGVYLDRHARLISARVRVTSRRFPARDRAMTESRHDWGDVALLLRKARKVPPYPWELLTHKGRVAYHQRYLRWQAQEVRKRVAQLGLVLPENWSYQEVAQIYLICGPVYDAPGFNPSGFVVDAGAGFGEYAVLTSRLPEVQEVYAFEPGAMAAQRAREFIAANHARAQLVEAALGSARGKLTLGDAGGGAVSVLSEAQGKEVDLVPVDDLPLERIDFIKINVEGAELDVLKGAQRTLVSSRPRLAVQCHTIQLASEVDRFLEQYGYRMAYHDKGLRASYPMDRVQNRYYLPPGSPPPQPSVAREMA